MADRADSAEPAPPPRGRLLLGGGIFVSGLLSPALVPLVTGSTLAAGWKTALSGLLLIGIPELFMLIAVSILGKPGYDYLKRRLLGFFGKLAPAERVGPVRHRFGLVLFVLPLLFGWASPYVGHVVPGVDENRLAFAVAGDLMLLSSFFVLGGEFWDRLRGIFIRAPADGLS